MNSKKIVSMIGAVVAASMALSSLPVCAAVTTMPDGSQFDASYYAATYPDVVAAFGTDANALYQHYKTFGIKEGRLPYAAGTAIVATTAQTTRTTNLSAAEKANAKKILRQILSGKLIPSYYYSYGFYDNKVDNQQFAIADLNRDGMNELYVLYSYAGWNMYTLQNGKEAEVVRGYNPSLDLFHISYSADTSIDSFDGTSMTELMVMSANFGPGGEEGEGMVVSYSDGTRTVISNAEFDSLIATFLDISNLASTQALTKANVNAIK